jgi:hypothetical protein
MYHDSYYIVPEVKDKLIFYKQQRKETIAELRLIGRLFHPELAAEIKEEIKKEAFIKIMGEGEKQRAFFIISHS